MSLRRKNNTLNVFIRHLVHASDVDQAEALLSRWGPEGQGKLGGQIVISLDNIDNYNSTPIQTLGGQILSRIR